MRAVLFGIFALALLIVPVPGAGENPASGQDAATVEERRLRISLQHEIERLRVREESLRLREMELKTLEEQVDKKIAELERLRADVGALMARKDEEENRKIRDLSQMYQRMEPNRAAAILMEIEEELAVGIFAAMNKKSAGRILQSMPQEHATRLTEAYPILGLR